MDVGRQISQHRARIQRLRREAAIGGLAIVTLVTLATCAFIFEWHPLVRALLIVPAAGMLVHSAAPYTRIRDHRKKIRELEAGRPRAEQKANDAGWNP